MDRTLQEPRLKSGAEGTGTASRTANRTASNTDGAGQTVIKAQDRLRAARVNLTMRAGRIRLASRFILMAILACLASIVWLSQTSTIVSLGYQINGIEKRMVQLNRQAEQLKSQVAQFENLKRIEEEARSKLGMVPASKAVYIKVPAGYGGPEAHPKASLNPTLVPINDWWRELSEMFPRQERPATRPDAGPLKK